MANKERIKVSPWQTLPPLRKALDKDKDKDKDSNREACSNLEQGSRGRVCMHVYTLALGMRNGTSYCRQGF